MTRMSKRVIKIKLKEAHEGMERCLKLAEENPSFVDKFLDQAVAWEKTVKQMEMRL